MTEKPTTQLVPCGSLPLVSFVIPVRDDAVRLRQCLASIRSNIYPKEAIEVVVVDNGSRDGSAEVAIEAGACLLRKPGLCVGEMRNEGTGVALGDIVAFVDADHVIDQHWLAYVAERFKDPAVGATGTSYFAPPQGTWVQRAYDRLRGRVAGVQEVEWLGAGNFAIRRQIFLALRGFDTSLNTCEDVDLCNRLRASGYRLVSDDRLRSIHLGDPTTLRALFFSELWRGRDNIRVTLRGPLTLRSLPSLLVPILNLILTALASLSILVVPWGGSWLLVICLLGIASLGLLRTVRMMRNDSAQGRWRHLVQAFAVACTYEAARALALVSRVTHKTRRVRAAKGR